MNSRWLMNVVRDRILAFALIAIIAQAYVSSAFLAPSALIRASGQIYYSPPTSSLFDSCDSLTPSNGDWIYQGVVGAATLSIDSDIKIEGAGSIRVDTTSDAWDSFIYKRTHGELWDLRSTPILSLWLRPANVDKYFDVFFETNMGGWKSYSLKRVFAPKDEWTKVTVDLRIDANGNPLPFEELQYGFGLGIQAEWKPERQYTFWIDEVMVAEATNDTGFLGVKAFAGDTQVIANVTVEGVGEYQTPFVLQLTPQNYTLTATWEGQPLQTKIAEVIGGTSSQVTFTFEYVPPEPLTLLRVEGNRILDSNGNEVILRGVNFATFTDSPDGWWTNYNTWEPNEIRAHLRDMRLRWGFNVVRFIFCVAWWIDDNVTFQGNQYSYRSNIEEFVQIANEEGIYVIFVPYNIVPLPDGGNPDVGMPYPPGLTADEEAYLPNEQAFIDFWVSIADRFKDYPNVIYDPWSEPHWQSSLGADDWFSTLQKLIDTIRQISDHIIMVQWGWNMGSGVDWVFNYPLNGTNLLYQQHIYRRWGNLGGSSGPTDYDSIKNHPDMQAIKSVVDAGKAIMIGETGAYQGTTDEAEREALTNTLKVLNEWGVSWAVWVWRPDVPFSIITSRATRDPNIVGQEVINNTK